MSSSAPAVAIDLGTTYSCVAVFRNGKVEVIANATGSRITPSAVAFTDNEIFIGEAAINQAGRNHFNMIFDAKRMIGRKFFDSKIQDDLTRWPFEVVDDDGYPSIKISTNREKNHFFPDEISALVLKQMKATAETYLGQTVTSAVVTVPAYFNDSQRRATKDAGVIAGLNILRIISEPTAAAIAYGFDKKIEKEQSIIVYDLGGGTFDVSILSIKEGILIVKATAGDTHLGGEDFNNRLIDHVVRECKRKYGLDVADNKKVLHRIRSECEKAKRALSISTNANIEVVAESGEYNFPINRATFENMNMNFFEATIDCVKKALQGASMDKNAIDEVVLVGGSTRIPKIRELLREFFNGKKLNETVNPDEAVAYGAAVHAAQLNNDHLSEGIRMMLIDVNPLSLGISSGADQRMSVVIPRNTAIPTKKTRRCTTTTDNQTEVSFRIFEGEHLFTQDNSFLRKFSLFDVKPGKANEEKFDLTFSIDANGILTVTAVDIRSGNGKEITISNDGRFSKATIERMIEDIAELEVEDLKSKRRSSIKMEFESYCHNMKSFLKHSPALKKFSNDDDEKKSLLEHINGAKLWLDANQMVNPEQYEDQLQQIKDLCEPVVKKFHKVA